MSTADEHPQPDSASPGPPAVSVGNSLALSGPAKFLFFTTGVVLPVICFAIGFPNGPTWQSGRISDYAQLLLAHKPTAMFYPLLAYPVVCTTLLVFRPATLERFAVRLGIYTGVPLALHFWVVFVTALSSVNQPAPARLAEAFVLGAFWSSLAVFVPWLLFQGAVHLVRRGAEHILVAIVGLAIFVVLIVVLIAGGPPESVFLGIFVPLLIALASAPAWAVASYVGMTICLVRARGLRRLQFTLAQLMAVCTWFAAYLSAWRVSIDWMFDEYHKLPVQPPSSCYISTAAARGHRWLVRSQERRAADGTLYRVNDQVRRLKAAELLLAQRSRAAHRACRWVYDRVGPSLAAMLVHPLLADLAYLALKPAEWLARVVLAVVAARRTKDRERQQA